MQNIIVFVITLLKTLYNFPSSYFKALYLCNLDHTRIRTFKPWNSMKVFYRSSWLTKFTTNHHKGGLKTIFFRNVFYGFCFGLKLDLCACIRDVQSLKYTQTKSLLYRYGS